MADLDLDSPRKRCGIYLRMSLDRELGIDRQREDCWKLFHLLFPDWEGVEFVDNDKSATKRNIRRPAYDVMCKELDAGDLDAIICWSVDRLYRTMRDLLPLIDLFTDVEKRRGLFIEVKTCKSGLIDLSTPAGRLNAKIQASVAEHEGEVRTERQKRALKQLAENGRGWGPPMFGFEGDAMTVDEETGKPKPGWHNVRLVPEEANEIRQAYADFLAGDTLYSIAKDWNDRGVRTKNGKIWTASTVRRLLDNPKCAGLRAYGRGEGMEIVGRGDWPAIVDETTWEQAHHILSDTARRTINDRARKYLLGGILKCGTCGDGLGTAIASGRGYPIYKCKVYAKTGTSCGGGVARKQEPLDNYVRDAVIKRLARRNWSPPGNQLAQSAVEELHAEAGVVRLRMDGLTEDYADGTLDKHDYRVAKARLEGKLEAIESQLQRSAKNRVFDGLVGLDDPAKVAKLWDDAGLDRQRALLEALFEKIVVHPLPVGVRSSRHTPPGAGVELFWRG